ncbi:bestrophin family protein [Cupriavidus agavae]|uniref:Putative membrane protein n=1 Tax=Cupriavidus agavae TaxID=1001822 RepID=A0A4Q7R851_9BURK|nr:bestrophin family ion channel [Cupriavidus agavae]RZT29025.1 putative membrane protein [Cupriavidus agavae]
MIVRPPLHWLRMLFVLRGSVLPRITPQLVGITLFAALITLAHGRIGDWKVSLNFVPFSLIGLTLAIFLGFRNSTSYARYWEARTLWGSVLNETRSLTRQALTLVHDRDAARQLAFRLCAFVHALRHQLRGTDAGPDIALFLDTAGAARLQAARFKPAIVLLMAGEWVGEQVRGGRLAPSLALPMESSLSLLSTALGGCERLAGTPIPFTYSVIIHRCIYLYCVLLPFGLLDSIGLMTPVIVCFIAYTFFALEALSAEIEEPFGEEANDLPLAAMSYMIESTVLEMVGEPPRTAAPAPQGFIQT